MGNKYKRVTYIGVQILESDLYKCLKMRKDEYGENFQNWIEKNNLDINGHEHNMGNFGVIHTDDEYVCLGEIVDAVEDDWRIEKHIDLLQTFEETKFRVAERLRVLKITVGEVKLYAAILGY